MYAEEIISKTIPSLGYKTTIKKALEMFNEYKIKHLPVVNDGLFLGVISEDELLHIDNLKTVIKDINFELINAYVFNTAQIYDVISILNNFNLTSIPVINQQKKYIGLISNQDIIQTLATHFSIEQPGGIIVLEIDYRDNSLSHIAQIVEADNAQILSSYVSAKPGSTKLTVTLKVNKTEIRGLVASFERFNYQVMEVFNNTNFDDGSQERYDSLMNYLNV